MYVCIYIYIETHVYIHIFINTHFATGTSSKALDDGFWDHENSVAHRGHHRTESTAQSVLPRGGRRRVQSLVALDRLSSE